jgi:hypothetical protein
MVMKMNASAKRLAGGDTGSVLTNTLEAMRAEPRGAARVRLVEICRETRLSPTRYWEKETAMIRKLPSGGYRLYSRKKNPKTGKRRNLGTFKSRAAAEKHERAVQYFKRGG